MRICSLLPSATDIVCALGLVDQLVAVTHECDLPAGAPDVPVITRSTLGGRIRGSRDIHHHVAAAAHTGSSLYVLDQALLERLDPDLILTQELCEVCAISYRQVADAVHRMDMKRARQRATLSLEPRCLADILAVIEQVGIAAGVPERAARLVADLQGRIDQVVVAAGGTKPVRVFAMEWLDPLYTAGHWVPEMVRLAGGHDDLAAEGGFSVEVSLSKIATYDPEALIVMPCSFSLERTLEELPTVAHGATWTQLSAWRSGRIYAVDSASYFSRSGPNTFEGLQILGEILHPDRFGRRAEGKAWVQWSPRVGV